MSNIILLVFCFAAGVLLRRTGRFPDTTPAVFNAFIINIGLPAMALGYLRNLELSTELLYPALMPWIIFVVGIGVLWPISKMLQFDRRTTGCVILVGGLANTSFIGIPMIEAFYGASFMSVGIVADLLGSYIVLSFLGITVARIFAVGPKPNVKEITLKIIQFPPFVATIAAILLLPVEYPQWLEPLLHRLSATVAPLALISVGFQLRLSEVSGKVPALALALSYKLVFAPLIILVLFVWVLGVGGQTIQVTIFEAAMAPMIGAAIVAMDNDLDPPLATLLVGLGVPLSFITLAVWHYVLRGI